MVANIPIPEDRIVEFCRKWGVQEFSLFGSVLRDDFRPESDVDVLVAFQPGRSATLEEWLDMEDELRAMFGREVDLVERRRVTNPFRRHHILTNRRVIYAVGGPKSGSVASGPVMPE
jgi:predicted nucleotidyltransferase